MSSRNEYSAVNVTGPRQIIPTHQDSAGVVVDTNTSPLALTCQGTIKYQEWTNTGTPTGAEYTAGATGVTLPAGKIVSVYAAGNLVLDRSPSSWPPAGPLG